MLVEEHDVKVETDLYAELKRDLGKNFQLFADTVNLKEWKKKGPYVPPEADMGSKALVAAVGPGVVGAVKQSAAVAASMSELANPAASHAATRHQSGR